MHVAQRAAGAPARGGQPGRRCWSSTCSASTARTSPARPLERAPRAARGARAERRALAGAGGVRRRARCCFDATQQQGLEGIVSKRRSSRYVLGAAHRALAEVPAPATARRTSSAAGGRRTDTRRPARRAAGRGADRRRAGLPRPGRQRDRRQGGPARCSSCSRRCARDDSAVRRRGAAGRRARHRLGASRWSSSTSQPLGLTPAERLRQPSYRGVRTDLAPDDL